MNDARIEALLKRTRIRNIPEERLTGYTAEVRRRLHAQPSRVVRVRPHLTWWTRFLVPLSAAAAIMLVVTKLTQPVAHPLRLADASLEEEAAVLTLVAPEESVLPEDDATLLEELERLENEFEMPGAEQGA